MRSHAAPRPVRYAGQFNCRPADLVQGRRVDQSAAARAGRPPAPARSAARAGRASDSECGPVGEQGSLRTEPGRGCRQRCGPAGCLRRLLGRRRDRSLFDLDQGHRRLDGRDVPDLLTQSPRRSTRSRPWRASGPPPDRHGLAELPRPAECHALAEIWRPYRTIASWYIWRNVDTPPVK